MENGNMAGDAVMQEAQIQLLSLKLQWSFIGEATISQELPLIHRVCPPVSTPQRALSVLHNLLLAIVRHQFWARPVSNPPLRNTGPAFLWGWFMLILRFSKEDRSLPMLRASVWPYFPSSHSWVIYAAFTLYRCPGILPTNVSLYFLLNSTTVSVRFSKKND